jgi:hypothetical protein
MRNVIGRIKRCTRVRLLKQPEGVQSIVASRNPVQKI